MHLITSLAALPDPLRGSVIAIGNFDGVHLGHRALLAAGRKLAKDKNVPFGVLTFEPHPRKLFRPDDPPFCITPPVLKYRRLEACGVDFTVSLNFNWDFASQSADAFVKYILQIGLSPSHIIIGHDFRFGQLRKGDADTIRSAGLEVTQFAVVNNGSGEKYSSTSIRQNLRGGEIDAANDMLGWDWEVEGIIVRGDRRGHELGYPTANFPLGDVLHPAYGVYATLVQIDGENIWRTAATNIGICPMFEVKVGQVEAHILDFGDRDIYGKNLRVRLVKRLRGEAKFDSLDALIIQIEADCRQVRAVLN